MERPAEVGMYERYPPSNFRLAEGGRRLRGETKIDQADLPLVSIVTVVRNGVGTLQRCIDSVQNQIYKNVEHIVIDGGSTDGTLDVINSNDSALDYFISEPDSGIYAAMNKGIRLSHGCYLAMVNSDDWLTLDGAEKSVRALEESDADFSVGYANVFNECGEHFHTWEIGNFDDRILVSGTSFCHQAVFAHKACYNSVGLYDESLRISADYKWVKSLFLSGKKAAFINESVVNFSYTGLTVTHRHKWKEEAKELLRETFPFVQPDEANDLVEYVYRDGALTLGLLPLLQRGRENNQFLVSVGMLLMQRLVEAEARLKKLEASRPAAEGTSPKSLLRRIIRKLGRFSKSGT